MCSARAQRPKRDKLTETPDHQKQRRETMLPELEVPPKSYQKPPCLLGPTPSLPPRGPSPPPQTLPRKPRANNVQPRLPRRSTIEVRPTFSEAPHVRSSIPHPKTDISRSQNKSRRITPWPESTTRFSSKSRLTFRRFRVKEPRLSETK